MMSGSILHVARLLLLALAVLASNTGPAAAQEDAAQDVYRLGPAEEIGLRVVVWDSSTLTFTNLDAIGGSYSIAQDGTVMLPIVGAIPAAGSGTVELAERIADALKQRTGLNESPSVAIEILNYRPVFVLGEVAQPGEYRYRPGMRAMQLLALAGGYYRPSDEQGGGLAREGIRLAGTLRENRVALVAARIREARLLAESEGETEFELPEGLSHPDGEEMIQEIYQREKDLLEIRREALARAVESLESSRDLLETEVATLVSKGEGLDRQVELMADAVGNVESLAERGLTVSSNLLNMQRALFELESRQLDTQNQVFRARQSIGEIERDLNDVTQRRATDTLGELQNLQAQIAQMEVRDDTQQRLMVETQAEVALQADADEMPDLVPVFRVSRERDGQTVTEVVKQTAALQPLDVLEVFWADPAAMSSQ